MRITKQTKYLGTNEFFELYGKLIKDPSKGTVLPPGIKPTHH